MFCVDIDIWFTCGGGLVLVFIMWFEVGGCVVSCHGDVIGSNMFDAQTATVMGPGT